jgi:signal transduction histidine kinase
MWPAHPSASVLLEEDAQKDEAKKTRECDVLSRGRVGPHWRRAVADTLLSMVGVVLVTSIIAAADLYPQIPGISMVYLLVVVALASTRGLYAAILAAVLAVVAFDFFFVFPPFAFALVKLKDLVTLSIFLITAVVTGQLTAKLRRTAEQAQQRERDMRRLYKQAQELAALQERQRLARELHDSVSQALYGISLGAHTAREALEGSDPDQTLASLEYVIALAEAGLAEMRALIFELRPESLETEGLVAALQKQVTVLRARYHLTVEADLGEEGNLSLEWKEALYRIAQEALHNIVKHAHASTVTLRITRQERELTLEVGDNGRGFDPSAAFPGHLGLHSMQERAERLGGTLTIEGTPGRGAHIKVHVPTDDREMAPPQGAQ